MDSVAYTHSCFDHLADICVGILSSPFQNCKQMWTLCAYIRVRKTVWLSESSKVAFLSIAQYPCVLKCLMLIWEAMQNPINFKPVQSYSENMDLCILHERKNKTKP